MRKFQLMLLRWIIKSQFGYGNTHRNIENMYYEIRDACEKRYTKDASSQTRIFLEDRFNRSQNMPWRNGNLK